jgi:phenylalanyl-tRNA synthetase beta chain
VREKLLNQGLQEFLTCDLIGPTLLDIIQEGSMPLEAMVKVLNPTSIEQSILRTSLLPGLLQVIKYNFDHQNHAINGFEIGRIHFREGEQYKEQSVAGLILTGKARTPHWERKAEDVDFYDLKGIIETVFHELGIDFPEFKPQTLKIFHTGRQASIYIGALEVGSLGEVHPAIQRRLDVPQRILFAEFNLHDLFKVRKTEQKMEEIPIYPSSARDWTVTLPDDMPIEKVLKVLHSISSPLLEEISILDIFRSEKLGKGKKNATLHFIYRDKEKTIELETVEREHEHMIKEALKLL